MKGLPLGVQEFSEFKKNNYLYIDKTKYLYKLLQHKYFFFSRPRRFGKSLTVSTLKEIFEGNKNLFEGLWIYDKIEWNKHPVIKISFSNLQYKNSGLADAIISELDKIAQSFQIKLSSKYEGSKFRELIEKLAVKERVVVLIDEYDKPIIDYIDKPEKAEENRDILKNFYSIVKDSDAYLRFFFVTGVSKFSQVSIFSDLNNLTDISIDENFSQLAGYTQYELEHYFADYIENLAKKYSEIYPDILQIIKEWYNGYSWDGLNFVYNPFSILNLFYKNTFEDFWFRSGTPTFLIKLIKNQNYTTFDIAEITVSKGSFDKYEVHDISIIPLLFQTGYLTIKEINYKDNTVHLDYPNKEVASAFSLHLLSYIINRKTASTSTFIIEMINSLRENNINEFIDLINAIFEGIPYSLVDNKEKYFHSYFHLIIKMIGFTIESEILTIRGRIDSVLCTEKYIYIIEFKLNQDPLKAIKQIKEKRYANRYITDPRIKILIGINFDTEAKKIKNILVEELKT